MPDDDNKPESAVVNDLDIEKREVETPAQSSPPVFVIKCRKSSANDSMDGSISSNNISIRTLEENECNSSVVDSDSDEEPFDPEDFKRKNSDSNEIVIVNNSIEKNEGAVANLKSNANSKLNIGSIAVQNSSEITFGNKTFYQGPVTIKQFLYDNDKWQQVNPGKDNLGFDGATDANTDNPNKVDLSKGEFPNFVFCLPQIFIHIAFFHVLHSDSRRH